MFGEDRCSFGWRLLCALCTDFVLNSDVVLKSGWLGEAPVTSAMATVAVVSRLASKSASPRSSSSSDSEATQIFPAPALKKTSWRARSSRSSSASGSRVGGSFAVRRGRAAFNDLDMSHLAGIDRRWESAVDDESRVAGVAAPLSRHQTCARVRCLKSRQITLAAGGPEVSPMASDLHCRLGSEIDV
ncbi:hypothetical protein PVAP13_3KG207987 [Panicum virgatum]|uniref:Uncharacterized protein n=1 Tax=Panicum virgatum TaxID=38727 RepID=A0A8T0UMZ6_PANVG|nr:hypothetical protein PVAP13_3KG207987 [Panicum virgatum]